MLNRLELDDNGSVVRVLHSVLGPPPLDEQQLANARLSLQSALIEYRESIAAFDGRRGVLLDRYRSDLPDIVLEAIDEALSR